MYEVKPNYELLQLIEGLLRGHHTAVVPGHDAYYAKAQEARACLQKVLAAAAKQVEDAHTDVELGEIQHRITAAFKANTHAITLSNHLELDGLVMESLGDKAKVSAGDHCRAALEAGAAGVMCLDDDEYQHLTRAIHFHTSLMAHCDTHKITGLTRREGETIAHFGRRIGEVLWEPLQDTIPSYLAANGIAISDEPLPEMTDEESRENLAAFLRDCAE